MSKNQTEPQTEQPNPLEEFVASMSDPMSDAAERVMEIIQAVADSRAWMKSRIRMVNGRAAAMIHSDVATFLSQNAFQGYMRTGQEIVNLTREIADGNDALNLTATTYAIAFAFWSGYLSRAREESQGKPAFVPEGGYVDPIHDGTTRHEDERSDAEKERLAAIFNGFVGLSDLIASIFEDASNEDGTNDAPPADKIDGQ